tara:strand:- start:505 stop:1299 length:795 start_codon:yes stop_codon:yes gene_type:complete
MTIFKHNEIDIKKINYLKPEKQGMVYYSPINYNNEPFYIQVPKMKCLKNGCDITSKTNTIDLENTTNDLGFYDFFLNLDDLNIKKTFENNKEWFNKSIPLELIDDMYKRTIKGVKKDTKPKFSFKVPVIKDKIQCQIYDKNKTCLDVKNIESNSNISCILHIKGLKFLRHYYYCDCYISQIKVHLEGDLKFSLLKEYAFDDKDDEENELKELEKELKLDSEFLESMKQKEDEKNKLIEQLKIEKDKLNSQTNIVKELESKIQDI